MRADLGGFAQVAIQHFGGNTTQSMKDKLGVPNTRPLPTITITAKKLDYLLFRANLPLPRRAIISADIRYSRGNSKEIPPCSFKLNIFFP